LRGGRSGDDTPGAGTPADGLFGVGLARRVEGVKQLYDDIRVIPRS